MRIIIGILFFLIVGIASGCTIGLTSEEGDQDGVIYHLPRSLLTITVRQYHDIKAAKIWYTLGGPAGSVPGSNGVAVTIKERDIHSEAIPDPLHRYVIKYNPSRFSDDRLCISRQPNGLLYDVQFAADDRTPQIAFNIARFLGGFIGSPSPVTFGVKNLLGDDDNRVEVREYTAKVDPFEKKDVKAYNRALRHIFSEKIAIDFSRMRQILARSANTWPKGCSLKDGCSYAAWAKRCDKKHICYRTKLNLPVDLQLNKKAIDVKYTDIINPLDVGTISVTRAFLVQKITKLRFQDGALLAAIIRKPSEVEEASLLPLNVMNAILSVPSGLWQSAFSDQKFKQDALTRLAKNEQVISNLKSSHESALLEGEAPVTAGVKEKYQLNCSAPGRPSNFSSVF